MNWFNGNIAEAVNLSKSRNAIFVVYCEGTDDMSKNLTLIINSDRISSKLSSDLFVAIKIQSDSDSYAQFAQIYKLVPVPSIFFIGKNGTPLDVVTGITKTVEELETKMAQVLERAGLAMPSPAALNIPQQASSSGSLAPAGAAAGSAQKTNDDSEIVCEGGVCYKKPSSSSSSPTDTSPIQPSLSTLSTSPESTVSHEAKLQQAKELLDKKRKEKEAEAARLEKERELQRRRTGQDLQDFKQRHEENEKKKQQEERKRDKQADQAARQKILAQIAQDKAERAAKFNQAIPKPVEILTNQNVQPPASPSDKSEAKIQFKKPDGETEIKIFKSSEKFEAIRAYVEENAIVGSGIREFALATTFPKKEFKSEDNAKTLLELNLAPTSVILILPLDKVGKKSLPLQTGGGVLTAFSAIFWGLVNTFYSTFSSGKEFIVAKFNGFRGNDTGAQKRQNEDELTPNDAAKRRNLSVFERQQPVAGPSNVNKTGAYKRVGGSNVHKLSDIRDSDDENNTWNGNSTQQQ